MTVPPSMGRASARSMREALESECGLPEEEAEREDGREGDS